MSNEPPGERRRLDAADLENRIAQHLRWVESNGRAGAQADLRQADLTGADLDSANLKKANLFGAVLDDARLIGPSSTRRIWSRPRCAARNSLTPRCTMPT